MCLSVLLCSMHGTNHTLTSSQSPNDSTLLLRMDSNKVRINYANSSQKRGENLKPLLSGWDNGSANLSEEGSTHISDSRALLQVLYGLLN